MAAGPPTDPIPGPQDDIFGPSSSESNTTVASPVDTASSKTSVEPRAESSALADPVLLLNTATPASASIPVSIPTGDVVPPNDATPDSSPTAASYAHGNNCHHDVAKSNTSVKPHAKSSGLADPVNTATSIPTNAADIVVPPNNGTSVTNTTAHGDGCDHDAAKSNTQMTSFKPYAKSSVLADPVFLVNTAVSTSTPVNPGSIPTNAADIVVPPNNGTSVTNPTATPYAHGDGCAKSNTLMTSFKPRAKSSDLADPVFQVNTAVSTSTPVNPGSIPSAVRSLGY